MQRENSLCHAINLATVMYMILKNTRKVCPNDADNKIQTSLECRRYQAMLVWSLRSGRQFSAAVAHTGKGAVHAVLSSVLTGQGKMKELTDASVCPHTWHSNPSKD